MAAVCGCWVFSSALLLSGFIYPLSNYSAAGLSLGVGLDPSAIFIVISVMPLSGETGLAGVLADLAE